MCNCRSDLEQEQRLLTRFKEEAPDALEHSVNLVGYTLIIGNKLEEKGFMEFKQTANFPLKKGGGFKVKTQRSNMIFTYCPFCGENYDQNEELTGRKAIFDNVTLRAALVGLVGAETEEELKQIEASLRALPAPEADKAVTINAIHALLSTMPVIPVKESSKAQS